MKDCNTTGAAGSEERTGIETNGAGKAWERPAVVRLRAGGAENTIGGAGPDANSKLS